MKNYYIYNENQQVGPLAFDEIKVQNLTRKTPVWYDGLNDWTPIENIPELIEFVHAPPPFNENTFLSTSTKEDSETFTANGVFTKRESFKGLYIIASLLIIIAISMFTHFSSTQAEVMETNQLADQQEENDRHRKEEERRMQEERNKKNMNYRNNWEHYISAGNNDYVASSMGGIYGLEVIVINNTDNVLDGVVVDVSYLKSNGDVWKQVKVPVDSVAANSTKAVSVDNVEKGVAVSVNVNSIMSRSMHFFYSPEYASGNSSDPFFYK